jgi:hypothetical protein
MRWTEEVELLTEEMRRVLAFLLWEAGWWKEKARGRASSMTPEELEGAIAYAERQADIRLEMRDHFARLWRYAPRYVELGTSEILEEKAEMLVAEDDDDD